MSWIPQKGGQGRPATALRATTAASSSGPARTAPFAPAASLEQPIVVSVSNLQAPIYATLIAMTGQGARLRTAAMIDNGTVVEFDIPRANGEPFTASGHVIRRSSMLIASRFEYDISFETMGARHADTIARYVRDLENRAAAARAMKHAISMIPTTDRQRRSSFRAATSFAVAATILNGRSIPAAGRCADISTTGMRFLSLADIELGATLALDFMLPSEVLNVHAEETLAIDLSTSTVRSRGSDPRRQFAPMKVQAHVVSRSTAATYEVYGLQFLDIDGIQREEIARFTHAIQLAKIKNGR